MPDETNPSPRTMRVRNIRADRQSSMQMRVERLTVNTDDSKDAASELLNDIKKLVSAQTTTLETAINNVKGELASLKRTGSASGTSNQDLARALTQAVKDGLKDFLGPGGAGTGGGGGGGGGGGRAGGGTGGGGGGRGGNQGGSGGAGQGDADRIINTLQSSFGGLKDAMEALRAAATSSAVAEGAAGGGGGEGGGGVGGGRVGFGEVAAIEQLYRSTKSLSDHILNNKLTGQDARLKEVGDRMVALGKDIQAHHRVLNILETGLQGALTENVTNLVQNIQNLTKEMADLGNTTRALREHSSTSLDIATTGIASLGQSLLDISPGLSTVFGIRDQIGDNIADTFAFVRSSIESDLISPIGIMGSNLEEVATTLYDARSFLQGMDNDAARTLDFRKLNESLGGLVAIQSRASVQADIRNADDLMSANRQLNHLQMIAANTGRTTDELIKLNAERGKDIAESVAAGILDPRLLESYTAGTATLAGRGMGGLADVLRVVAGNGGSFEKWLADNQEKATGLAASGAIDPLREVVDLLNSGGGDNANRIMEILAGIGPGVSYRGAAGADALNPIKGLLAEANMARGFIETQDDVLLGWKNWLTDTWANVVGAPMVTLGGFLTANAVALFLNTRAIYRLNRTMGGRSGRPSPWDRKKPPILRDQYSNIPKVKGAGLRGARKGLLGRGIGKGAAMMGGRLIPGVGAALGLGLAAHDLWQGDVTGALVNTGAGLLSTFPGFGTAAAIGLMGAHEMGALDGLLGSPAAAATTPAIPIPTSPAQITQGVKSEGERILVSQRDLLQRVVTLMEENNDLTRELRGNGRRYGTTPAEQASADGWWAQLWG